MDSDLKPVILVQAHAITKFLLIRVLLDREGALLVHALGRVHDGDLLGLDPPGLHLLGLVVVAGGRGRARLAAGGAAWCRAGLAAIAGVASHAGLAPEGPPGAAPDQPRPRALHHGRRPPPWSLARSGVLPSVER